MLNWLDQSFRDVTIRGAQSRQESGFHVRGGPVARDGHHGHHRDLQRPSRGRAESLSVQRRRSPDERPGLECCDARLPDGILGRSVHRARRAEHDLRRASGVIASTISDVLWIGEGDPQRLRGNHGTFNTFDVMGVPPLLGRTPTAEDARPGARAGRRPRLSVLAAPVRRRPERARSPAAAERHQPHGDRRHAEAIHVARRRRLSSPSSSSGDAGSRACDPSICSGG